jgi:hypothetical protein
MMKKKTAMQLTEEVEEFKQKHNSAVNFIMEMSQRMEQINTLLHVLMLNTDNAVFHTCSGCKEDVLVPTMKEFEAFPICPNHESDPLCAEGFSHIEKPASMQDFAEWDDKDGDENGASGEE